MPSKRTQRLLKEIEQEEAEARLKKEAEELVAERERELQAAAAIPVANVPARDNTPIGFDPMAFADAVGIAVARTIPEIIKALKEKDIDPDKERIAKIKEHRKQQMREDQRNAKKGEVDKWLSCSHMRTHPYTGTSRIGWAQQSDGYVRGVCMGCGCPFTPIESELPDADRMAGMYVRMRAVPMSITHNDFTSGMVVAGNPA